MSKSLNARVMSEINRREKERKIKEMEEEKAKNDKTKETIMSLLKKELEDCLKEFKEFYSYEILDYKADYNYKFQQNAEELGFTFKIKEKVRYSDSYRYILTVPAFEKGKKRTPAQLMLYKFERELSKKKKERKTQLTAECKRVKQEISEGNYTYSIAWRDNAKFITVKSEETFETTFEINIITKFFYKYDLYFNPHSAKMTFKVKETE